VETARRASMSAWNGFVDCESVDLTVMACTQAKHQPSSSPPISVRMIIRMIGRFPRLLLGPRSRLINPSQAYALVIQGMRQSCVPCSPVQSRTYLATSMGS
jgi:hypothetical protein